MHGYMQRICAHASILRVGAHARAMGDKWEWSVVACFDGSPAPLIQGLGDGTTAAHVRAGARVLWLAGFRFFKYYRAERDGLRLRVFAIANERGGIRRLV